MDADLELASAFGRDPLCSYQGPEGTRPSRIDGMLVDTRLAALLHAAELLPRGAIPGHTLVRFDLHLKGASQRVVKFIRPKPVEVAPCGEREQLLLVHRLPDPLEASWRAALSTGDVDQAWAFGPTAGRGNPPRPLLPGYRPGLPSDRGRLAAGPTAPAPGQGDRPAAS